MALDVNGYNSIFKSFVNFAETNKHIDKGRAILDATPSALTNRGIKAVTIDFAKNDSVHNWTRGSEQWEVNDRTRGIFKASIASMFGGEARIPESVRKAMIMDDFDCGKPLTARRILAVKAAIDAEGSARAKAEKASLARIGREAFKSPEVKAEALKLGFVKGELPKLARAAHLYAQTAGVDEMTAMKAVAEPNSKPNRLMQYGGRFLANAENFANGLRLMDSFETWFKAAQAARDAGGKNFANVKTVTELNLTSALSRADCRLAFERFLFEDLSIQPGANLAETDPEKLFGVKNNAAMRFFATGRHGNFVGVLASVPPEKRRVIFAVFDKLSPALPETRKAAISFYGKDHSKREVTGPNLVIGRILRNLQEIERQMGAGKLTEKSIARTLFPDMPSKDWSLRGINDFTHTVDNIARDRFIDEGMDEDDADVVGGKIQLIMEETCCTIEEAIDAYKTGRRVAPPQYMTTATYPIEDLDGTTRAARGQLDGNTAGDLWRPYDYGPADDPQNASKWYLKTPEKQSFGFAFPDGTRLKANPGVYKGNIPTILDKLETLAGKVHPRQQVSLMYAVSQAGIGALKGGLMSYGVFSTEHATVNFDLSRNEETGAITVKYSSPEGLPVRFSWTSTIDVAGNMVSTPMVIEKVGAAPVDA